MAVMPYMDREKQKEFQRNWMAAKKTAYFTGKVCVVCGQPATTVLYSGGLTKKIWLRDKATRERALKDCPPVCERDAIKVRQGIRQRALYNAQTPPQTEPDSQA